MKNAPAFFRPAVIIVFVAACSSSSSTATTDAGSDTSDTGPSQIVLVGDSGNSFSPSTLTIKPGETVTWKWNASGHSVVSGPASCAADGKFTSPGLLNKGKTFSFTFPTAGTFPYFCDPHCSEGMTGVIKVVP